MNERVRRHLLTEKGIWRTGPLAARARRHGPSRPEALALEFDRRSHGRLRMLIDPINRWPELPDEAPKAVFELASSPSSFAGASAFGLRHERRRPLDRVASPRQQLLAYEVRVGLGRLAPRRSWARNES